jgi:hypothetical protein
MDRDIYEVTRHDPTMERRVWEAVEEFLRERYDERDAMVQTHHYLEEQDSE